MVMTKNAITLSASSASTYWRMSSTRSAAIATMNSGSTATVQLCGRSGRFENTMTKAKRESASGSTHMNGAAAMSVEMCAVTEMSSADGTAASAIHRAASRQDG